MMRVISRNGHFSRVEQGGRGEGFEPLPPIGFERPLTVDIRYIYLGRIGLFSLLFRSKIIAVYSKFKAWGDIIAPSGVFNFSSSLSAGKRSIISPSASIDGTSLILDVPKANAKQIIVTIELLFSYNTHFLLKSAKEAIDIIIGAPLWASHKHYYIIYRKIFDIFFRVIYSTFSLNYIWEQTFRINLGLPGTSSTLSGFHLLSTELIPQDGCKFEPDLGLIMSDGLPYRGSIPYIVVAIYGGP